MKQIITLLAGICIVSAGNAFEIRFSSNAELNIGRLEDEIQIKKSNKNLLALGEYDRRFQGEKLVTYKKNKTMLLNSFSGVVELPDMEKIVFTKIRPLKGIQGRYDVDESKHLAKQFITDRLPEVLGDKEGIKVLYVKEDYGADQEKDENGKILDYVSIKTYSYTVRLGRTYNNLPIFNSYATIEIDAATLEVCSFDLTNWKPVSKLQFLNKNAVNKNNVKGVIKKRLDMHRNSKNSVRSVTVDDIIQGWVFNENSNVISPAFVHYGSVDMENTRSDVEYPRYSFLEKLVKSKKVQEENNSDDDRIISEETETIDIPLKK